MIILVMSTSLLTSPSCSLDQTVLVMLKSADLIAVNANQEEKGCISSVNNLVVAVLYEGTLQEAGRHLKETPSWKSVPLAGILTCLSALAKHFRTISPSSTRFSSTVIL